MLRHLYNIFRNNLLMMLYELHFDWNVLFAMRIDYAIIDLFNSFYIFLIYV